MGIANGWETAADRRVLLIDENAESARHTGESLRQVLPHPPDITLAEGARAGLDLLRQARFDIVLVDMPSLTVLGARAEDVMARLVRLGQGAFILAMAEGASVSAAVGAMRAGAHDYLAKPIAGEALASRIDALARRHGRPQPPATAVPAATAPDFAGFVGESSAMHCIYEQIGRIAASSAPVFITGESGTGKEVCAEALHAKGPRAAKRFIAINCAAIPRDLMESEVFGVARGAFTGAHADRKGAAELADGGTLFLDEIGEMDIALQSKLLRFLQTGTVSRIGETAARRVDIRVICATNRNPLRMIAERQFREDLFYRLHVLPIHLPPLRQRPGDVMGLARYFLAQWAREEHKDFSSFTPEAARQLTDASWPGNVRQLQNLVRRIVVMFDGGAITTAMLDAADIESQVFAPPDLPSAPPLIADPAARGENMRSTLPLWRQEQRIIEDAIAAHDGNISLAAAALEISPSTIYRKRQNWADMAVAG